MTHSFKNKLFFIIAAVVLIAMVVYAWYQYGLHTGDEAFISSNGRIEATEVDIATKLPGRVGEILVEEGSLVKAGDLLATMQVQMLEAQLREASAQYEQAVHSVASAEAQVAMRQGDKAALAAQVRRAETEVNAAQRRLNRSEALVKDGATSAQVLDDDRARLESAQAGVVAAQAQVASADAAIAAAEAYVISARSHVKAVKASQERIQSEIDDSQLRAPRDGRVQFRLAQPGEVLGAGGRVMNLLDLSDVYMTFFLPTTVVGRLALGEEVRIVLDAAPDYVIPAQISFIASNAQFTPKTVETASEREKLMFRVRARIDRELLRHYLEYVKTGLPGEAWIRLDPDKEWPEHLAFKDGA